MRKETTLTGWSEDRIDAAAAVERDIVPRTFEFGVQIIQLCVALWEQGGVGRVLTSQIVRAGTSVGSMVEEAQAAESRADFVSKMGIGLKEARETHYRLRQVASAGILCDQRLSALIQEVDEIRRILGAIIVSAKRNSGRGKQMKN